MAIDEELTGNRLLDALPREERANIRSQLREVGIHPYDSLIELDERISQVFFPTHGVISLVTPLANGVAMEAATVGNEGMIGFRVFLEAWTLGNTRAIAQVPGEMLALDADIFRERIEASRELRNLVNAYTHWAFVQISQNVACAGLHNVTQRTARWILESHDRVRGDTFRLTHEFLAEMLGVTRPPVSVVAHQLQEKGLISYQKGQMTILDGVALEHFACECYAALKLQYEDILGPREDGSREAD